MHIEHGHIFLLVLYNDEFLYFINKEKATLESEGIYKLKTCGYLKLSYFIDICLILQSKIWYIIIIFLEYFLR